MQVGDFLPGCCASIGDEAVAGLLHAELGGNEIGDDEEVPEECGIGGGGILQADQMLFGNDDDVDGSFGGNIGEGDAKIIFIDQLGGDFVAQNFAEDGGVGGRCVAWVRGHGLECVVGIK